MVSFSETISKILSHYNLISLIQSESTDLSKTTCGTRALAYHNIYIVHIFISIYLYQVIVLGITASTLSVAYCWCFKNEIYKNQINLEDLSSNLKKTNSKKHYQYSLLFILDFFLSTVRCALYQLHFIFDRFQIFKSAFLIEPIWMIFIDI